MAPSPSSPFSRSVTKRTALSMALAGVRLGKQRLGERAAAHPRALKNRPQAERYGPRIQSRTCSGGVRNSSGMATPRGLRACGRSAISTSSGTITVRDQYDTFDRWNGNHSGRCMISSGITGTARHGTCAEQRQLRAGEDVGPFGAAGRQDGLARAAHVRRVGVVADRLQREIRLDAGGEVERAVVEQRPAAMRALDARAGRRRSCASSSGSMRSRKCSSSTYSAGMVASASSSNSQCPSACCCRNSALRARSTACGRTLSAKGAANNVSGMQKGPLGVRTDLMASSIAGGNPRCSKSQARAAGRRSRVSPRPARPTPSTANAAGSGVATAAGMPTVNPYQYSDAGKVKLIEL